MDSFVLKRADFGFNLVFIGVAVVFSFLCKRISAEQSFLFKRTSHTSYYASVLPMKMPQ